MALRPISFLFDLDGTLVDSVYAHVLAWQEALQAEGIDLSVWRIHRKIGMSGGENAEGPDQIEYEDEDPAIFNEYAAELKKNGVENSMPRPNYRKR